MIIDATNQILGRISTISAKAALMGENVSIVNCEKAILSGDRKKHIKEFERKRSMGIQAKGPFYFRKPSMYVKRVIRGMLPYKQPRGRESLKRIKCYSGVPEELKGKEFTKIEGSDMSKLPITRVITVGELCKIMGVRE